MAHRMAHQFERCVGAHSMTAQRGKGEGSIYQRADGKWVGAIELGWTDKGTRRRKRIINANKKIVVDGLRELRNTAHIYGGDAPNGGYTIATWLDYWLTNIAAPRVRPRTLDGYRTSVTQHIVPFIGKKRLDKLTPAHIRQVHVSLDNQGLAGSTALKAHRVLSKALVDAEREGHITRNVAELVDAPRKNSAQMTALTADQARTLLASVADDRLSSRWVAALSLGARQGELLGLQWDHVNFDDGTVDLSWQLQRLGYQHGCTPPCGRTRAGDCPKAQLRVRRGFEYKRLYGALCLTRPKSRAGQRVIPMPAALHAALKQHANKSTASPHGLVWTRPDGQPIDPRDDLEAWHDALTAAKLPSVQLHAARHTTATLLLEAGVDTKVIAAILGHSDAVVTRGYQHVNQVLAAEALDRLDNVLAIEA